MQTPQFCPNSGCEAHHEAPSLQMVGARDGTLSSTVHRRIQRFRYKLCDRGRSAESFNINYYAKRRVNYRRLVRLMGRCCAVRRMARILGVA